ncbi:MAG: hypothetical protein ABEN55_05010, partial [Bradymonadaceae bacterium]
TLEQKLQTPLGQLVHQTPIHHIEVSMRIIDVDDSELYKLPDDKPLVFAESTEAAGDVDGLESDELQKVEPARHIGLMKNVGVNVPYHYTPIPMGLMDAMANNQRERLARWASRLKQGVSPWGKVGTEMDMRIELGFWDNPDDSQYTWSI